MWIPLDSAKQRIPVAVRSRDRDLVVPCLLREDTVELLSDCRRSVFPSQVVGADLLYHPHLLAVDVPAVLSGVPQPLLADTVDCGTPALVACICCHEQGWRWMEQPGGKLNVKKPPFQLSQNQRRNGTWEAWEFLLEAPLISLDESRVQGPQGNGQGDKVQVAVDLLALS